MNDVRRNNRTDLVRQVEHTLFVRREKVLENDLVNFHRKSQSRKSEKGDAGAAKKSNKPGAAGGL